VSTVPVKQSIIRDCSFNMPSTNHGQGLSLYQNSWQNALVEHNLFLNCRRALAFQPGGERRTTPGEFRFENNLIVYDDSLDGPGGGQQSISFNGNPDDHLDSAQTVIFRSNTVLISPALYDDNDDHGRWAIGLRPLRNSTVLVENNFAGSICASRQVALRVPHQRANNLLELPGPVPGPSSVIYGASWGSTDVPQLGAYATIIDYEALQLLGTAASAASDGGRVGIRWGGQPSMAEIRTLSRDWFQQWPAEAIPSAVSHSDSWYEQDLR
jgi:hypothetical protein